MLHVVHKCTRSRVRSKHDNIVIARENRPNRPNTCVNCSSAGRPTTQFRRNEYDTVPCALAVHIVSVAEQYSTYCSSCVQVREFAVACTRRRRRRHFLSHTTHTQRDGRTKYRLDHHSALLHFAIASCGKNSVTDNKRYS